MSNLEIVKPTIVDGIEFYVSKDGKDKGVSQVGTAKLCGVNEIQIRRVINTLSDRHNTIQKELEHLVGADLYLDISSNQQAKVLKSSVVASIISYYAFQRRNEIAIYSAQKFLSIGIDNWISEIVGCDENNVVQMLQQLNTNMGKLMVKVERLEEIEEETMAYRKATATMSGLKKWMDELNETDKQKLLEPAEETFTVKEALAIAFKGTTFSDTQHKKLALKVGQTITALTDNPNIKKRTKNSKGYGQVVNAYTRNQIPLIKLCMQTIMAAD